MTNKEFFAGCWKAEGPTTAAAFKSLPEDNLDYKPHQKSRSARELIEHLLGHNAALNELLDTGKINAEDTKFSSIDEAVNLFNSTNASLEQKLQSLDDKKWSDEKGALYLGGNKVWEDTYSSLCWAFLFDRIHHRGQLSTYIRPMGGVNPSIYGPTAEMMEEMMKQAQQKS